MILTQCPVCAVALPALTAKQCSRCKTRYCGPACQKQHWEQGGHDKLCKLIRKGGGAEQYNANTKYAAAVAVAAEKCAEDTKGQTCYICTQALHWKTKEGLVRGCSCRGTAGFAHVSCLAEQAKILCDEVEENNLDNNRRHKAWERWHTCSLCEQQYHGVVRCALGWACWKTYVGRLETNLARQAAMTLLGNGLANADHHEDALTVREADFSSLRRLGASEDNMLVVQSNLANTYSKLGRNEDAARLQRHVYYGHLRIFGEDHGRTIVSAYNCASTLGELRDYKEVKDILRRTLPVARRVLGENNETTLRMRWVYALALYANPAATFDDIREAVMTLEDMEPTARRVLGGAHPLVVETGINLRDARAVLRAREAAR